MIINLIGWLGTTIVIGAYALSVRDDKVNVFHYGNSIGSTLLVPAQLLAGVPYSALLSGMFGMIGFIALKKKKKENKNYIAI